MGIAAGKGWLIAVSAALIAGCAVDPSVKPWWTLGDANFRSLQVGQTTKAEVRSSLGRPVAEMVFARQGEEVWDYRFVQGTLIMYASVHFDTRGIYKYYTAEPDLAFYSIND